MKPGPVLHVNYYGHISVGETAQLWLLIVITIR